MLYLIFATVVEKTYCQKSEHMVFTQTILTTLLDLDRPDGTTVRGGHMTKSSDDQVRLYDHVRTVQHYTLILASALHP